MRRKIQFITYNLNDSKELHEFLKLYYQVDKRVESHTPKKWSKVADLLNQHKNAILIFKVKSKSELTNMLRLLRKNETLIQNGVFKSLCLFEKSNSKAKELLLKYNCTEVIKLNSDFQKITSIADDWVEIIRNNWDNQPDTFPDLNKSGFTEFDQMLAKAFGFNLDLNELNNNQEKENLSFLVKEPDINLESGSFTVELKQKIKGKNVYYFSRFKDLFEESVSLTLPRGTQLSDEPIYLKLNFEYCEQTITINSKVEVLLVEDFDEIHDIVHFQLSKKGSKSLQKFIELISQRQDAINDFLMHAKGY